MNCTRLRQLNLDRNQIKGRIPLQLGELTNLEVLRLDENILQGTVPESIGNLLLLEVLSLSNNRLYGPFPKAIIGCASLRFLCLSENMLAGNIPADVGKLQNLSFLLLSGNQFSGHLPFERKFLMQLEVLDVSRNTLDSRTRDRELLQNLPYASHIPSLSNCWPWQMVRSLQFIFDIAVAIKAWLSQNSLYPISQHVPSINHKWQHTSPNCILPKPVMPYRHLLQTNKDHDSKNPFVVGVVAGIIVFICILLITAAVIFCRKKMRDGFRYRSKGPVMKMSSLRRFQRESSRVFDPTLKSISMRYLFKATDGFDMRRVVGDGGFGLVYWATMEDGRMMAVKKLATDGIQGKREFEAEMETLGRIKHPNLIELLAYCKAGEDRVLVYEFVRNGSLDTWLHEREDGPKQLNWSIRLKIACGSAKGLCYLHHESNPHIIHRDIKSSNILLGDNFEPKIADFGLARALSPLVSHVSTDAAGTLGYMAPEYVSTMFATKQADVYSFGMVMLELVTGKRPNMFPQEKTFRKFHKWARHMLQIGHEMDMLDPALKGTPPPDHVRTYFGVACDCVSEIPNDRPTMREVNERLSLLAAMQCS
ncbi:hypothetical protein KP509_26G024000 [Ceratopteris richardii]|nr:hypothetical protein KP509_26G024000 [Ceratopteris richardii]